MSKTPPKAAYGDLLQYAKPYKWILLLAFLGAILDAIMQATFTALLKPILDDGFAEQDPYWIKLIPILIVGLFIIRSIGNFVASYGFTWAGRKVVNDLRRQVFNRYLTLPQSFYDQHAAGGLISRITYDIEQIANGVTKSLIQMLRETLAVLLFLSVMFYYAPKLALVALVVFPVVAVIIRIINKRFRRIGRSIQASVASITQIVEEVVKGQKIVKIFRGQEVELKRFNQSIRENRQLHVKIVATQELTSSIIHLMVAISLAVIMYIAAKSNMSPGTFMAFMTAMLALMPSIKRLSQVFSAIQTTLAAADSVMYVVSQDAEVDQGYEVIPNGDLAIQFEHVGFKYDSEDNQSREWAINDFSLDVAAGEIIALVGASGSGKTTLAHLVPRFYQPTVGTIRINGIDLDNIGLSELRDTMAMVSQEVVLFNDTVKNNIAYGCNADKKNEDIVEAARKANALGFIEALPEGFETLLGDNGTRLSGGQRQRIAIARAILKDAPILILDEATSALDTESEKNIQAALQTVMNNKTTLVIAHRLSTIENADKVVVLDQGQVAQVGTHDELMAVPGIYAQLQQSQLPLSDAEESAVNHHE